MPEEHEKTEAEETAAEQNAGRSGSRRNLILIVALAVIVAAAIGLGVYIAVDNPKSMSGTTSAGVVPVTDGNFDQAVIKSEIPALVLFCAPWSGPSRVVEQHLPEVASEYNGRLKVCTLEVEANPSVCQTFGVRGVPTLLFFRDGQMVDQMVGALALNPLKAKINAFLGI